MKYYLLILILVALATSGCSKTIKYQNFEFEDKKVVVASGMSLRITFDPKGYFEKHDGEYLNLVTSGPYSMLASIEFEKNIETEISFHEIRVNGHTLPINQLPGHLSYNKHLKKFVLLILLEDIDLKYQDADVTVIFSVGHSQQQIETVVKTRYKEGKMSPLMRGMLSV